MARNKTAITIALILTFTMAVSMIALPVSADAWPRDVLQEEWPTWVYINFAPNPVGVGQSVTVNVIFASPLPTGRGAQGDLYKGITVDIVRPDGTKETQGPFTCDPTGGTYFMYTPAATGNYTFQAFYPGQICDGVNPSYPNTPAWGYGTPEMWNGTEALPCESSVLTLTVQADPVEASYKTPPLPTEYWTRSITAQNWDWGQIAGNWMNIETVWQGVFSSDKVQIYTTGPNSPHILWTKNTHFGGVVGWPTESDQESQYMLTSMIISYISNPVVLNGIMFFRDYYAAAQTFGGASGGSGQWHAIDIRTGEEIWTRTAGETGSESISVAMPLTWHTRQEFGAWSFLVTSSGGSMRLYDARTGSYLAEIDDSTGGSGDLMDFDCTEQGTILKWYTTSNDTGTYLNQWNMTQVLAYRNGFPSSGVHASTIRVSGTYDHSRGLEYPGGWTKKIDTTLGGQNSSMNIQIRTPEVIMMREYQNPTSYVSASPGWQVVAGYSAKDGSKLWGPINQTLVKNEALSIEAFDGDYYVMHSKMTHRVWGYSLRTGQQIWGPVQLPYNGFAHLSVQGRGHDGKAYINNFGGYVYCIDMATGNLDWTFTRGSAGYDTPFGVYPQWYWSESSYCDGKLYLKEGHEYNPPQFPGRLLCINATTGELVWSILFCGVKSQIAHADGIAVDWNANDGNIYSFGKGPTQTTVKIEDDVTAMGQKVVVKGMVTDISTGTRQSNIAPRFPNGVAAVSDADQREWMEYVYMQQVKPAATGVPVTITVYDPNGNTYEVGTTTSDGDGYYGLTFDPPVPGEYVVTATFCGSESYWGSFGRTHLFVDEGPAATPAPTPMPASMTDTYVTGFGIGIIIAIVVIGLLIILMFRKR